MSTPGRPGGRVTSPRPIHFNIMNKNKQSILSFCFSLDPNAHSFTGDRHAKQIFHRRDVDGLGPHLADSVDYQCFEFADKTATGIPGSCKSAGVYTVAASGDNILRD